MSRRSRQGCCYNAAMCEDRRNDPCRVELAQSLWTEIANCLEKQKTRVYEEIRNYPTPITACDQQFNFLLDEQTKIRGELTRMRRVINDCSARSDAIEMINEFIKSSDCIDVELKQSIRSRLRAALPEY